MSASIIQRSPDPFTDLTLPRLYRDPVLNKGSLFLFDFLDSYGNPNPDGALASGATFKNLVDGAADAVFDAGQAVAGQASVSVAPGRTGLVSTGTTANTSTQASISLGSAQPTADKPFAVALWNKGAGQAFTSTFLMIDSVAVQGANGTTNWAWTLYQGAANAPQAGQRLVGGSIIGPAALAASTAVRQLGLSWAAGQLSVFADGALVASAAGIASPIGGTGRAPILGLANPGKYYRAYMERLDLSGRTALAAIQADYAANSGRFA